MLAAPIIHARTKYNDFPFGLLVSPENFSPNDVKWARAYINQSTRFLEMGAKLGRRVVFSNASTVVTGISICISDLYELCGKIPQYDKVYPDRNNFAFIGLAIPKSEIRTAFDVPYSVFLEQYESYMHSLWETPYSKDGLPTIPAPYTAFQLPQAEAVCEIPDLENKLFRIVLDMDYAPLDAICAKVTQIAKDSNEFAFCSDIPNAVSVIESQFSVVTAKNAPQIIAALELKAKKDMAAQPQDTNKLHSFINRFHKSKSHEVLDWLLSGVAKTWKAIPKAVKIGSLIVVALSSAANKKKG